MSSQRSRIQYPELFHVNLQPGDYNSSLTCRKSFKAGQTIVHLTGTTGITRTWASVQYGPGLTDNIDFDSVLVYTNHCCSPNVLFDTSSSNKAEWTMRALCDIDEGRDVTFFYPSTEWDMAQGFRCKCGAPNCLGEIKGAKYLERSQLEERGFVSAHIAKLVEERDSKRD